MAAAGLGNLPMAAADDKAAPEKLPNSAIRPHRP